MSSACSSGIGVVSDVDLEFYNGGALVLLLIVCQLFISDSVHGSSYPMQELFYFILYNLYTDN
jgi:hypothetical protein